MINKERIKLLPVWNITEPHPAFYDIDSKTAVGQTARVYAAMLELQEDYNKYVNEINTTITTFINDVNADQEEFINSINKIMHDYIAMLDEKIKLQDKEIQESIVFIKENLTQGVIDVINQMVESGELENAIVNAFDNLGARVTMLENSDVQDKAEIERLKAQYINAKDLGAVGDGVTDDYESLQNAIYQCADNNKKLFIPNGTYLISQTLKFATSENDERVNKLFNIEGESSDVIINKFSPDNNFTKLFDFQYPNYLRIKNITTENLGINLVPNEIYSQGFEVWSSYLKKKDFIFENLIYNGTGGGESYYHLICTPAPEDGSRYADGKYARYPLRINSNSGYNAIEIENFNYNETDNSATATDNSAIGIIDRVTNSTGVFFVDMKGDRSFERYVRSAATIQSLLKPGTVYEVSKDGHIAIGCSTDYNDGVAKSVSAIKIRDNSPEIAFFDANNNNKMTLLRAYKDNNGNKSFGIIIDGDTAMKFINEWRNNSKVVAGVSNVRIMMRDNTKDVLSFYIENNEDQSQDKEFVLAPTPNGQLRYGNAKDTINERQRVQTVYSGNTGTRLQLTSHWRDIGIMFFDTTLNKPIWWNGTNWVDANGSSV